MQIFMLSLMGTILVAAIMMIRHYSRKNTLTPATYFQYPAYAPLNDEGASSPISSPSRAKARLKVLSGPAKGKSITIEKPSCLIERDSLHLALNDPRVSREHAIFKWDDGSWYLKDLGSTNGTYLNNKKLVAQQSYPLPQQASLQFGNSRVEFESLV
ncbi:MAG: FHA domain-containing protein [Ardenticatenaceae bacterium]